MRKSRFGKGIKQDLTIDDLLMIVAEGKNGRPNYGFILYYYRVRMGWTAEDLALYYSEALENELVTASWIYIMENQNKVPHDENRRWILARLLDIPSVLFGLNALSFTLAGRRESLFDLFSAEKIDTLEYRTKLEIYCNDSFTTKKLFNIIPDIKRRIDRLESQAHYPSSHNGGQIPRLLCEYRSLLAVILHDYQLFDLAIASLNKTIFVAEREKFYDIWAYALKERGIVYLDRGELIAGLSDFEAAKQDFDKAVDDFDAIKAFSKHLSPQTLGLVHSNAGRTYAHVARDEEEFNNALRLIDQGAKAIGRDGDNIVITSKFDEIRYLLDRGKTFIVSPNPSFCFPQVARKNLEEALDLIPTGMVARQVEAYVRLAESYFLEGQHAQSKLYYPDELVTMAVGHAEAALELLQDADFSLSLTRLENLYNRLKESPCGKSEKVAQLKVEIVKAQRCQYLN